MVNQPGTAQFGRDLLLRRSVKHGCNGAESDSIGRPTQMGLHDLTDVHTSRHAQRTEDDVDRATIVQIGHVLDRDDFGNDTLVSMTTGHLVALGDLATLGDTDTNHRLNAGGQVTVVLAIKHLHIDNLAARAVRQTQTGILDLASLVAKNRAQQLLFRA